nr:MAG: DNA pilot protein [Microviridae sp.]
MSLMEGGAAAGAGIGAGIGASAGGIGAVPGGLIGGLVGGGLGLVGDLGNFFSNRDLQEKSWARDDNAIQRRVADMKAAGINPMLAAGNGASNSPVISQNSFPNLGKDYSQGASDAQMMMDLARQKVDISKTLADTESTNLQNKYLADTITTRSAGLAADLAGTLASNRAKELNLSETQQNILSKQLEREIQNYDYNYFKSRNLPSNTNLGEKERIGNTIGGALFDIIGSKGQLNVHTGRTGGRNQFNPPFVDKNNSGSMMNNYMLNQ